MNFLLVSPLDCVRWQWTKQNVILCAHTASLVYYRAEWDRSGKEDPNRTITMRKNFWKWQFWKQQKESKQEVRVSLRPDSAERKLAPDAAKISRLTRKYSQSWGGSLIQINPVSERETWLGILCDTDWFVRVLRLDWRMKCYSDHAFIASLLEWNPWSPTEFFSKTCGAHQIVPDESQV